MSILDTFKLPLKTLAPGQYAYAYHLGKDFFEAMESDDITDGDVDVKLGVQFDGDIYTLHIEVNGTITVACDRCLDDMTLPAVATYDTIARYGDTDEVADDDTIILAPGETALNVAPLIYDTVALTIPLKHVHPDGQCNPAMSGLLGDMSVDEKDDLGDDAVTEGDTIDPRWEALRGLKNDKK